MMTALRLPTAQGTLVPFTPVPRRELRTPAAPARSRIAYAAAHVVCDPLATRNPPGDTCIDWDATLAYRHYLWSLGFGVAEAMDTAQRGMGLNAASAMDLCRRSLREASAAGGVIACGAGTDQLDPAQTHSLAGIEEAYLEQCDLIESHGGHVILMASRALAAVAKDADDYAAVYANVLAALKRPAILHWLGDMFDPALAGYWGSTDLDRAADVCLRVIGANSAQVEGIKMSLLDRDREIAFRRRLPHGVRMYTGDDFNYPELIRGDEHGYSDALLGILDGIALPAACALAALDAGDAGEFEKLLAPTLPLARHIFAAPTFAYKTGLVFLAYLNGHQSHFRMIGAAEGARSITHLAELFRLADAAGVLRDLDLATHRMRLTLSLAGVE